MQNMYSFFNPQYHREQMMNAYNQYMNALYPQQQTQTLQTTLPQGYSIFPVSNIEEANATKTDLSDGLVSLQTSNKIDNLSTQVNNGFSNAATQLCGGLADVMRGRCTLNDLRNCFNPA